MRYCILGLVLTVLVPAPPQQPDPEMEDLAALAGTWIIVSCEEDGTPVGADDIKELPRVIIKGNQWSLSDGHASGTFSIDPTKKPKTTTYTVTAGTDKGQVQNGIYEITKDGWRDCVAGPGKDRPREFAAPAGSGNTLMVFRRAK